ncbi:hypothetical protein [Actinomadura sp. 3N508]|uniref:hypothetical protein n=1 Tax=Actinomadura sp. 3N508 TaxID=3375153 RepID=UPI0037B0F8D2
MTVVGNDHGGTLYPAAVMAVERLLEIVRDVPGPPRELALNIILDWWGTFQAEPGFEEFELPDGTVMQTVPAIMERVSAARPMLQAIVDELGTRKKEAKLLLACIDAGWIALDC